MTAQTNTLDKTAPTVETPATMNKHEASAAAQALGKRGGLAGTPAQEAARKKNAKLAGLAKLAKKKKTARKPCVACRLTPASA